MWKLGTSSTINWPYSAHAGNGNGGVAQVIKSTPGAIGYVDYADAKASGLTYASVQELFGPVTVAPSPTSASAAGTTVALKPDLTFAAVWSSGPERLPDHLPVVGPGLREAVECEHHEAAQGVHRLPDR